jgi:hypothetical protein
MIPSGLFEDTMPEPGRSGEGTEGRRERLRFIRFAVSRTPTAHCTAQVEVEWQEGVRFVGKAEGVSSSLGDLRLAALATLNALEQFADGAMRFELIGVKTLRAFDATVAIVSVAYVTDAGRTRLLGCHLADEDPLGSTVFATLQATNRVLGNYITRG